MILQPSSCYHRHRCDGTVRQKVTGPINRQTFRLVPYEFYEAETSSVGAQLVGKCVVVAECLHVISKIQSHGSSLPTTLLMYADKQQLA